MTGYSGGSGAKPPKLEKFSRNVSKYHVKLISFQIFHKILRGFVQKYKNNLKFYYSSEGIDPDTSKFC